MNRCVASAAAQRISRRLFTISGAALLADHAFARALSQVATGSNANSPELEEQLREWIDGDPRLLAFAAGVYRTCILGKIRAATPPLQHDWIAPGGGYFAQWLWDTMFVVDLLSLLPDQRQIIRGVFQNYWDFQQRWNSVKPEFMHGMIANFIAPYESDGSRDGKQWKEFPAYSQAPLLAWGMERVYKRNGDLQLLRDGLPHLEAFHEWYWRERDLRGVGLIGVGAYSGDTQQARYETYDREVDLDGLKMILHPARPAGPDNGAWYGDIAIPANTSYLLMSEQSLRRMATLCGNPAMAARCAARYRKGSAAMRKFMWDDAAGTFLAVRTETLEKIASPTVGGFMGLTANVATGAQARRVEAALRSAAWSTPLPVPTVSRDNPQFVSGDFWRGDVWPAPNYQVATGLAAYGFRVAAAAIADRTVANAIKAGISERYDSLSGAPLGVSGLGMSSTVLTMMLDGLTSSRYALHLRKTPATS